MSYFPFFMEIGQKSALVVGGGRVALRKIERLLPFGVSLTVVSPVFCEEIEKMEGICRRLKHFQAEDTEGMLFVIGATNDEGVNAEIAAACKARGIPVNIVDDAENCTFLFPALIKRGAFVAGFSTGGASPLAARYLREQVEEILPTGFEAALSLMAQVRGPVRQAVPEGTARERVLRAIFKLALEKNGGVSSEEIEEIIRKEGEV